MSRRILLCLAVCLIATKVDAQPDAWVVKPVALPSFPEKHLLVVDLATGRTRAALPAPAGATTGALSADGRLYLLGAAQGIAAYRTDTPQFLGFVGPASPISAIYPSPSGRWVHVIGPAGYAVLDALTGVVVRAECCVAPEVHFTPDGQTRIHVTVRENGAAVETVLTAYPDDPHAAWLRQKALDGRFAGRSISQQYFALTGSIGASGAVAVLDSGTGAEIGRLPQPAVDAAIAGDRLLVSTEAGSFPSADRLATYELPALTLAHRLDRPRIGVSSGPREVHVSGDGAAAYWVRFVSVLGVTVSSTQYVTVDLTTNEVVGEGVLGTQFVNHVTFTPAPACLFDRLLTASAPAEGAIVSIPVTPRGTCRPWSVGDIGPQLRVLDPGPHVGPSTIRLAVQPTLFAGEMNHRISIGGASVTVAQAGGVPGPPDVVGSITGNRVTLAWAPGKGAGVTAFVVRGALRGGVPMPLASLAPYVREWTSPPLAPGSYVVDLVGQNGGGFGVPSHRLELSVGVDAPPDPPVNPAAFVRDDLVRLSWQPAPSGPAPSAFVVEAAAAGTATFFEVARTRAPQLVASRVPAGEWVVRVRAATDGGLSAPSASVQFATSGCAAPPGPPTDLWALATSSRITLRFGEPATGSAGDYVVEAGTASGLADLGRFLVGGPQTLFEAQAPPGVFYLRVRAQNTCGESAASNEAVLVVPLS